MAHQSQVFMTILDLRPQSRPGFVVHDGAAAIVVLDSEATCAEGLSVSVNGLTTEEHNLVRAAFGEPPVPHPVSDFWLSDCRVSWELIPDELLVPSDLWEKQDQRRLMLGA